MDNRKHILFLSSWFPNRVHPTLGNFIQRHAEAVQLKHDVTVLFAITDPTLKEPYEIKESKENDVNIIRIYIPELSTIKKWMLYFKLLKESFLQLPRKVDLVHLNQIFHLGFFALYLKMTHKIPFVVTEHWTGYHKQNRKHSSNWKYRYCKFIGNKAEKLLPVSNDLASSMQEIGIQTSFVKVPNVVNTRLFSPSANKEKGITRFLHVSTLKDEHKNISGLVRTIAKLTKQNLSISFTICGDGELEYIEQMKVQFGIPNHALTIIGEQPIENIAELMKAHDAFILFSNYENLPCVILEAFSCGIPVISTDVGGISENFPAFAGKLIKKGDEEELFNAIRTFHKQPDKFDSKKIRDYAVEHFSIKSIAQQIDTVYQEILR